MTMQLVFISAVLASVLALALCGPPRRPQLRREENNLDKIFFDNNDVFNTDGPGRWNENLENDENDELLMLHVIFRHGNRTAESADELYPKDPYLNETYFPYGLGQLTNAGKRREFSIGTALRARYNSFLGKDYYPQILEATSTDYNRTKMSLQLVLAGLFPPNGEQEWLNALAWQPVPYNYLPRRQDRVLLGVLCPKYVELYEDVCRIPRVQEGFRAYSNSFKYLARYTGKNITRFQDVYNLYFGLATEEEFGYKLPSWTKKVWPELIKSVAIKEYFVATASKEMQKLASGYFLKKVIEDSQRRLSSPDDTQEQRRIHLYSGHESNIAHLLMLLGLFQDPHIPNYGAYILIEFKRVNGEPGFKFFYQNYENDGPKVLNIPGCDSEFCSMKAFQRLIKQYIPNDNDCGN